MRGTQGIEVFRGHARFSAPRGGPHRLEVTGADGALQLEAPRVVLDLGGRAVVPAIAGLADGGVPFLTNAELLELQTLPEHLVILGGSYIGLEFGQMFRRFGSQVTILERGPRLLPREDADVAAEVQRLLAAEGVQFRLGAKPTRVRSAGAGLAVELEGGQAIAGSHLLVAVGRTPNTDDAGLDTIGVKRDAHGYILVDDELRTNVEGVFAVGDCNGKGAFTHTTYNDFEVLADQLFGDEKRKVSDRIPTYAVYIDPPLGRVGLNEEQVRARGRPALVAKMPMSRVGRARERSETDGFLKAHVDAETKEILGASFLGIRADEAVQLLLPVMMAKQPYTLITHTVFIHPTVIELVPTLFETKLEPLK